MNNGDLKQTLIILGVIVLFFALLFALHKKSRETARNIRKIEDLRKRIVYTLGLLLIDSVGSFVVLPGINPAVLSDGGAMAQQAQDNGLIGLLNMFTGGAFSNASVFGLGVMPYITASIVIQLLGMVIPYFQKMQKDGESGRRKMNQWTRLLTIIVLLFQAPTYIGNLYRTLPAEAFLYSSQVGYMVYATIILIAGTMFIMWLGERITDKGIGNGISLIIMIGIVARLPHALVAEFNTRFSVSGNVVMLVIEFVLLFLVFMATIALVQAVRKVPVQYAKRIIGNKQYGGVRQYIPLKINAANVMPIIFAQAIMMVPMLFPSLAAIFRFDGFWYNFAYALLVIAFTYFYTAIIVNPQMMAEDMKRNGGFIPGVKPGKSTVEYIDTIMTRITLPGSIFLAIVAIMPAIAMRLLPGINTEFAYFFGGTSLLILVGVILDTLKQVESHLLNRHYDGLMKTGRIQGRG